MIVDVMGDTVFFYVRGVILELFFIFVGFIIGFVFAFVIGLVLDKTYKFEE